MGFALVVVTVSKQGVNATTGGLLMVIDNVLLVAGLFEIHVRFDVKVQLTRSLLTGI